MIDLDGNELRVIHLGQGDVGDSPVVWIPSLRALVAGAVAYNGTHVWLAEASAEQRQEWIANHERYGDRQLPMILDIAAGVVLLRIG